MALENVIGLFNSNRRNSRSHLIQRMGEGGLSNPYLTLLFLKIET